MSEQTIPITVCDRYAGDFNSDTTYETTIDYAEIPPAIDRGQPLTVEYPVTTTRELNYISQIQDQLARYNSSHSYESNIESTFDGAILDILPIALAAEGVELNDFDISDKYIQALTIKKARCITSDAKLTDYLHENEDLVNKLGIESVPDQSTMWRYSSQIDQQKLSSVVTRLVHAVYRNGINLPNKTKRDYNLEGHNKIDIKRLSQNVENVVLVNWVDELIDEIVDPLTFNRAKNKSYQINEIIGSAALGALINGPYSAPVFGSWFFDTGDIIGDHLYDLIKSLDKDEINEVFNQINKNIVEYASGVGFFTQTKNIALDTTWVTWNGKNSIRTIKNPEKCSSGEGWCFAALGLTSSGSRFTLGVDLVQNKSDTVGIFRRQLRDAIKAGVNIGRLHIDREFYAEDAVDMCRALAGDDFVIRIKLNKQKGEPPKVVKSMDLPPGKAKIIQNVDFAGVRPKVNVCGQRIPEKSNKDVEYMGFLTDLSGDDVQPSSLYQTYSNRWSIETYFHQLKNEMTPRTKSPYPLVRLFLFKLGTVFHNIHVLINNSRSPKYGYCPDVPYYQVLIAIAVSTLDIDPLPST